MAKKSKVKFEELTAADGQAKIDSSGLIDTAPFDPTAANPYGKYKTVYEICGMKDRTYKTNDIKVYEAFLREMNLADLQGHSYDIGILPTDNRSLMIDKLLREFKLKTSEYSGAVIPQTNYDHIKNDPELQKKVNDILSRSR